MPVDVPLSPWKRNFDFEVDPTSPFVFERYDASGLVRVAVGGASAGEALATMLEIDAKIVTGGVTPNEGGVFRLPGYPTPAEMMLSRKAVDLLERARKGNRDTPYEHYSAGYTIYANEPDAFAAAEELEAAGVATISRWELAKAITISPVMWQP